MRYARRRRRGCPRWPSRRASARPTAGWTSRLRLVPRAWSRLRRRRSPTRAAEPGPAPMPTTAPGSAAGSAPRAAGTARRARCWRPGCAARAGTAPPRARSARAARSAGQTPTSRRRRAAPRGGAAQLPRPISVQPSRSNGRWSAWISRWTVCVGAARLGQFTARGGHQQRREPGHGAVDQHALAGRGDGEHQKPSGYGAPTLTGVSRRSDGSYSGTSCRSSSLACAASPSSAAA